MRLQLGRSLAALDVCAQAKPVTEWRGSGASRLLLAVRRGAVEHSAWAYSRLGERVCSLLFGKRIAWQVGVNYNTFHDTHRFLEVYLQQALLRDQCLQATDVAQQALDCYRTQMLQTLVERCSTNAELALSRLLGRSPLARESALVMLKLTSSDLQIVMATLLPELQLEQTQEANWCKIPELLDAPRLRRAKRRAKTIVARELAARTP